ncbi:phage/plasmid primase, P4 family [Paraburkholderia nemoris]|uniref:DNA primase family protein n=1 Tax=Paraburkholderia nemoris TaxID=2793076 RepID=UPI001B8C0613|nr:DNA primase family protein [Paraburkholderia nemoris]
MSSGEDESFGSWSSRDADADRASAAFFASVTDPAKVGPEVIAELAAEQAAPLTIEGLKTIFAECKTLEALTGTEDAIRARGFDETEQPIVIAHYRNTYTLVAQAEISKAAVKSRLFPKKLGTDDDVNYMPTAEDVDFHLIETLQRCKTRTALDLAVELVRMRGGLRGGDRDEAAYALQVQFKKITNGATMRIREARAAVSPARSNDGTDSDAVILDAAAPLVSARALLDVEYSKANERTILHADGEFYRWVGPKYEAMSDDVVRSGVYRFLDAAKTMVMRNEEPVCVPFNPNRAKVADVFDAMKAETEDCTGETGVRWLSGSDMPSSEEIMPCANGLLHVKSGKLIPATPSYFTLNATDTAYDADAPEPTEWLKFLGQVLHDDAEAIREIQKIFGYMLTQSYAHQKIFLLVGPPRSGKGTVARVMQKLIGVGNVTAPSLSDLAGTFGLQSFISKSLAVFGDVRMDSMNSAQKGRATEVLLSISGGDSVRVGRKNRSDWEGQLPTRLMILSNDIPTFHDASMALANRFIVIRFKESFLGREDTELGKRIEANELPGILCWATQGWKALASDGKFTSPASAMESVDEMRDAASPIAKFARECCELGAGHEVDKDALHKAYLAWCESEGVTSPRNKSWLCRDLKSAFPSIGNSRIGSVSDRTRMLAGICLRETAGVEYLRQTNGDGSCVTLVQF